VAAQREWHCNRFGRSPRRIRIELGRANELANFLLVCSLLVAVAARAQSYTFTTFAGSAGVTGSADRTGSAARFKYPYGVATDSSGNVYVADHCNDTIPQVEHLRERRRFTRYQSIREARLRAGLYERAI
jgi:hypothetical protein